MIASIQGIIIHKGNDFLVVSVSGVGFQLYVSNELVNKSQIGETLFFHVYLIVREDSLSLYGFETEIEKKYFTLMLGVNGVGPRLALAIINTLSIDAINKAVISEQADLFARVPGVGKKTAQKIVIQLQGKTISSDGFEGVIGMMQDVDLEVLDALTALGYSIVEAQAALQSIARGTSNEIEDRLREALKYFS
ncbi:MAG: Holliday junction branch migration protein RuvA [Chloroflexi bacterium HGW-Chloroflexi-10]|nr:MAG: Holliday junction branch migration protein RuvA [Chloroflexi bacterium HGW-Chloroflexi-10]